MIALACAVVVAYFWWVTPQVWVRLDRYLALLERRAERVATPDEDPVPMDLLLHAKSEFSEEWAKDQAVEALFERRAQLGSWDRVRQLMVG